MSIELADVDQRPGRPAVRSATHEDLPVMSRTHIDLLPIGLFPSLGARFVRRWQRTFLDSRYGVGYVVTDPAAAADEIVGFLLGTTDRAAHNAALLANRREMASLAISGIAALLARPRVAARLLRSRARPWTRRLLHRLLTGPGTHLSPSSHQVAVLTALAVHPQWRGSGIGEQLVARFVEQAACAGATWAELVTSTGPLGAVGFYERLEWTAGPHRLTPDGEAICTYRRRLGDAGPP